VETQIYMSLVQILSQTHTRAKVHLLFINNKGSENQGSIPDVVIFDKTDGSLVGDYYVGVQGITYSMYSLFYYSESNSKPSPLIELTDGQLIKDFIGKKGFKGYKYKSPNDTNVIISITPEKSSQRVYVYTDKSKFSFDYEKNEPKDYTWTNIQNMGGWTAYSNEIIIFKNDTNFQNKNFYIYVTNHETWSYSNNFYGTYFLSVINEGSSIQLNEGVPHSLSLSKDYLNQSYVYNHYNVNNTLYVSLNVNYGKADFVISFKEYINGSTLTKYERKLDIVSFFI